MAININNLQNTPQVKTDKNDQLVQRQQTTVQQNAGSQAMQKQDSVSITPQAQQFSKLQEKASNSSGIDQEKVDKIKQAIAEGKYKINVEQLAKRIMQFEGDLFDR
ncbi:MAG: flagellar biosynthesis anti-sigma factor FlgM [Paraglaciecola sp.]|uniref:flagellar biosynthesis anti-sigma factor FlgM n=1 Tax=Alteromonadaceae TaxID=72275 RepID=UPI00273E4F27|nr:MULTISPECIES: flagellar biosynthesis anti-sigma factor FlgM [Alteromonadaceae]MDP4944216.1 flagellar biosynthesis anti-sigma factor FlgM [Alishewanella sp.]MDP5028864.1 flagellar biosynthesis anti-sigma factor FlgM [Paraglaciecola sp.]MDP5036760.1 flagellar biosynthesis anti-sigma factor FlgM [Alishewanella sp.]MDP5129735.1 flagellar biosynthesis anti-sigma factor FlgM [Paraglaciecola sp.]MDP5459910.1 flagellar biosynthesis anti-sigma factor FlgM [Alishewanella sp. SMS8]